MNPESLTRDQAEILASLVNAFTRGKWAEKPFLSPEGWTFRLWVRGIDLPFRISSYTAWESAFAAVAVLEGHLPQLPATKTPAASLTDSSSSQEPHH